MPEHYRMALLLKGGLGLRVGEVARATGTTPPAARARAMLYRARRALRSRLEPRLSET